MIEQEVKVLLSRYSQGKASQAEQDLLEYWYAKQSLLQMESPEMEDYQRIKDEMWSALVAGHKRKSFIVKLWPSLAVAASILLALSAGLYFYPTKENKAEKAKDIANLPKENDIAPGKNAATLTLADGRKIVLSDAAYGKLAEQAGVSISMTKEGEVIYNITDSRKETGGSNEVIYNTLSTARGEQYQVRLPDGTKAWLNAASSLKFPASFANVKERKVELTGEAYFEVASDKAHPFIVETDKQAVEVLGTHFNISSYADEGNIKTTLLEGRVRVALMSPIADGPKFVTLVPSQQSIITASNQITVEKVDVEEAVAWKAGYFKFNSTPLELIMKQIERWYNIDVLYQDNTVKSMVFEGAVSRYDNVSALLKTLENTGAVKFRIEGRRVYVEI